MCLLGKPIPTGCQVLLRSMTDSDGKPAPGHQELRSGHLGSGNWGIHWPLALTAIAFIGMSIGLYAPHVPSGGGTDLPLDKLVHFGMFAVVAGLAYWASIPTAWIVGVLLAQAVISELVQDQLLTERGGDVWDLVADMAGIAIGLGVARLLVTKSGLEGVRGKRH